MAGFGLSVWAGTKESQLWLVAELAGGLVFGGTWCYAAFAKWVTREDEEEAED